MPTTPESQARTRAFARFIGPWVVIVTGIIVLRASAMAALATDFLKNDLFVWFAGAPLLFSGLLIIAFSSVPVERGGSHDLVFRMDLGASGFGSDGRA